MTVAAAGAATTVALAARCAGVSWGKLPDEVCARAAELVLDLVGVALRGSRQPSSVAAREAIARLAGGGGRATVIGGPRLRAAWAALANGTSGHAIELDDVTSESSLHPGVAVIPAALALAEERGASGRAFVEAVVAGYEATMRVGNALNPASAYERGFHPTGVAGVFGAAAAASLLLGLDAAATARAFGVAGTMASGSLEYLSDGSWTKRLNPGWAGHAGIVAAELAAAGFRGPTTAIEGPLGVLHAFSAEPHVERLTSEGGWVLMEVSIKPYACCRYNHGPIDGVLRLAREHRLRPDDVSRIRIAIVSGGSLLVSEPIEAKRAPRNVVDAQFSLPFAAAIALVRGRAGLAEYIQENVDDPLMRSVMARVDCVRDPSLDALYPARWPSTVEIELRDGRVLRARVDDATGEPRNPVSRDGLLEKFRSLAVDLVSDELAERLLAIDAEPDLRRVGELLVTS